MAIEVTEWLDPRRIGSNMQPLRLVVTDDMSSTGLRKWTQDSAGNADQHTGTFSLYAEDGTVVIDAQDLETMTDNGELLYYPTLAEVDALIIGRYTVVFILLNQSATARDVLWFGLEILPRVPS